MFFRQTVTVDDFVRSSVLPDEFKQRVVLIHEADRQRLYVSTFGWTWYDRSGRK
jgi:hypothetical protein